MLPQKNVEDMEDEELMQELQELEEMELEEIQKEKELEKEKEIPKKNVEINERQNSNENRLSAKQSLASLTTVQQRGPIKNTAVQNQTTTEKKDKEHNAVKKFLTKASSFIGDLHSNTQAMTDAGISRFNDIEEDNQEYADFDAARLLTMQDAFNINTEDREKTYNMFRKLSTALGQHNGQENKYSGLLNKALDYGIMSKVILASGIATVAGPALYALDNGFDFSNFTKESGGDMLTVFLILAAIAGVANLLEYYFNKDNKEVVQDLKAKLQHGLTNLMHGETVDIKKLDNMAQEINSLCPDGKGFIAEYEQLKHHARQVDIKDSIIVGDSTTVNTSLAQQSSKVEKQVLKGTNLDKLSKNIMTIANIKGPMKSNANIPNMNQQKKTKSQ